MFITVNLNFLGQMWPPRDAVSRERFNRREMLMQTLVGALPPITCKLAAIANSRYRNCLFLFK